MENYKAGDRIAFIWGDKSYTPGTIKRFVRKPSGLFVKVEWDDKTSTRTSMEWITENTMPLGADKRPVRSH